MIKTSTASTPTALIFSLTNFFRRYFGDSAVGAAGAGVFHSPTPSIGATGEGVT